MKTVSDTDKQAIAAQWAHILSAPIATATLAPQAAPVDIGKEFCKDWPTAKTVLQALQQVLPQPGPIIVGLVIAAGDAASSRVCSN